MNPIFEDIFKQHFPALNEAPEDNLSKSAFPLIPRNRARLAEGTATQRPLDNTGDAVDRKGCGEVCRTGPNIGE